MLNQVLSTVDDFTNKFECSDDMKRLVKEEVFGARAAKVLFIESMLLKQFEIMGESPSESALKDMKSLVTRQRMFLASNDCGITEQDLHSGLWSAATANAAKID